MVRNTIIVGLLVQGTLIRMASEEVADNSDGVYAVLLRNPESYDSSGYPACPTWDACLHFF